MVGQSSRSYKLTSALSYVSRLSDLFLQCKKHYISYTGIGQVEGIIVSKGNYGIGQVGMINWGCGCFAVSMVTRERFFQDGADERAEASVGESLVEVGWSAEDDSVFFLRKL